MNITSIQYHKVFNLGDYQNEKIGIEIALSDGDDPILAHKSAVEYVEKAHLFMKQGVTYKRAKEIVNNPDQYTGYQVKQANDVITDFEANFKEYIVAYGGVPSLIEH